MHSVGFGTLLYMWQQYLCHHLTFKPFIEILTLCPPYTSRQQLYARIPFRPESGWLCHGYSISIDLNSMLLIQLHTAFTVDFLLCAVSRLLLLLLVDSFIYSRKLLTVTFYILFYSAFVSVITSRPLTQSTFTLHTVTNVHVVPVQMLHAILALINVSSSLVTLYNTWLSVAVSRLFNSVRNWRVTSPRAAICSTLTWTSSAADSRLLQHTSRSLAIVYTFACLFDLTA